MEAKCTPGFDGGHSPVYVLEVYQADHREDFVKNLEKRHNLIYNISNPERPHFEMAGLSAGTSYQFAAYVYNVMGQSAKILFNVTTLNYFAEPRSKENEVGAKPVINDPDAEGAQESVGEMNQVDPGLALLPIIAILCGVAIGLGTIGLGIILLVRGRTHHGRHRRSRTDSLSGSGGSLATPATYDACPSGSSSLTGSGEHFAMKHPGRCKAMKLKGMINRHL